MSKKNNTSVSEQVGEAINIPEIIKACKSFDQLTVVRQMLMQLHDKQLIKTEVLLAAFLLGEKDRKVE